MVNSYLNGLNVLGYDVALGDDTPESLQPLPNLHTEIKPSQGAAGGNLSLFKNPDAAPSYAPSVSPGTLSATPGIAPMAAPAAASGISPGGLTLSPELVAQGMKMMQGGNAPAAAGSGALDAMSSIFSVLPGLAKNIAQAATPTGPAPAPLVPPPVLPPLPDMTPPPATMSPAQRAKIIAAQNKYKAAKAARQLWEQQHPQQAAQLQVQKPKSLLGGKTVLVGCGIVAVTGILGYLVFRPKGKK